MKAVMDGAVVDVPQALLDDRRAKGIDRHDEVWDGVLHMVPPPLGDHSDIEYGLSRALDTAALARGLQVRWNIGLFRAQNDYRVPDLLVCRPEQRTRAGASGAELVVEVRSRHDETDLKIPWYAARGVAEIVAISQKSRAVELYVGREGKALPVPPGDDGGVHLETVGLRLVPVDTPEGRRLRVTGDGIDELV